MTLRRLKLLAILAPLLFLGRSSWRGKSSRPPFSRAGPVISSWLASCCSERSSSLRPSSASSAGSRPS